ncbi:PilT/PilU family type 4a pilus ATPase [Pseudoalteromonas sp. SG43-7]|jgi:twitching motility protein PilU|uniref:PilT/PilU family type 4a pilus ATPase n=2 Tax=Pseudoalteromonas TaxID=53246 RepID=A0ABY3FHT3_9GAMM|nr:MULTISPECIES: PilT/PilU family type 4a pilus ATPase [Pseudoalteromonas]MBB1293068.1 PilT/PilU family type 4a pilus ATPase [Pseudoalteromonas sp. SR41-4]MBB1301165.1 PilT/PilU family type 4a pilus ATPase [Pseudoalteromonas sp. SR44-8]MBB1309690.1 PilT/PilU family type 4a pilus ATPase [Pseudoalteromonas sp. SR41-8]MBB1334113.1 PilT/PilU family type 4a pilus ATPase [Pseudoalteromonas sp. SR41-6]MBB1342036.1 PilT/PilU family type 4a pilus ATPase [Pseudoalteromonas sp. SR45-6]|tara:strand:- start:9820 stop:10950 length:1131 start_codon:yes stop_codon:yes gene_type:complete
MTHSLDYFLHLMIEKQGSDLFVSSQLPVSAKINGELIALGDEKISDEESLQLVESAMSEKQKAEFHNTKECNFAIATDEGRFRISAFWQRDCAGMVIRRIVTQIPDVAELGLPSTLTDVIMAKRGLVLFVGGTGTGKSTSLAALLGYRNRNQRGHILTIEDPIEFVHEHRKSIITQREVGLDTESFEAALKSSLRQAPDVILIGEIRSQETMEYALSFAETGHLCVATLHANNANQAIDRIMHLVPKEKHDKLKYDLSLNLRAIIAQQLVPTADGNGRVAAIEILLNTPIIGELIKKGDIGGIKEAMAKAKDMGMQTFDQALFELYKQQRINYADALHHADSPNDLRLMIKLRNNEQQGAGFLQGVTIDGLEPKGQ